MLKWAIVPGRKLGERTDEWQQVAKEEPRAAHHGAEAGSLMAGSGPQA